MSSSRVVQLHLSASVLAVLTVASFITASLAAEAFGNHDAIASTKQGILYGLVVLIPSMAIAGLTGRQLAGRSRAAVVERKLRRMKVIAATGVFVLVPCAIILHRLAEDGDFGGRFATLQVVELMAGALNLTLLARNMRDGLALTAKRRARRRAAAKTQP